jgi:class III cytochrome C family protein
MIPFLLISLSFSDPPNPPVTFNHKKHLLLKLKCSDCHANPDPGETISIPTIAKCKLCHIGPTKLNPEIVPVSPRKLPNWVFWSHRTHLEANLECESCHDSVATITTMGGCVSCHQKNSAPTGCLVCHEGKS